jgi:hypothetical protein
MKRKDIGEALNFPRLTISIVSMFLKVYGSIKEVKRNCRPQKLSAHTIKKLSCIVCVHQW